MSTQALTAEEQLLRLIESGDTDARRPGFQDARTWAQRFFPQKEEARRAAQKRLGARASKDLNLKLINAGLSIILGFLLVAIVVNTKRLQPTVEDIALQFAASTPPAQEESVRAAPRPLAEPDGEAEKRDLFRPAPPPAPKEAQPKSVAPAPKPPEPAPADGLREKVKTLKLVGIAWGPAPIAMIEDTARHETSFVKRGQVINQMKVKTILKDRVVLSNGTADYDLF